MHVEQEESSLFRFIHKYFQSRQHESNKKVNLIFFNKKKYDCADRRVAGISATVLIQPVTDLSLVLLCVHNELLYDILINGSIETRNDNNNNNY